MNPNEILVTSLNSYIKTITRLRMHYLYNIHLSDDEEADEAQYSAELTSGFPQKLYFRGQANKDWPIYPCAFRENALSCEAEMIHKSYLSSPDIVEKHKTPFERLTVLQHYELGTRLLDITGNPLVALYFACQLCHENVPLHSESEAIKELTELGFSEEQIGQLVSHFSDCGVTTSENKDGVVYFKCAYAENFNKTEIQILAHLAEQDMRKRYTITDLLESLESKRIITSKEAEKLRANQFKNLIGVLQSSFCVESNFSNTRLIRQDGSFLISGHINIRVDKDGVYILEKAVGNLNDQFESERIIIPEEHKETILRELDLYNINERSLLPELDHQLKYIQNKCKENSYSVPIFERFQKLEFSTNVEKEAAPQAKIEAIEKPRISEEYLQLIKPYLTVDWEKKENSRANILSALKRYFIKDNKISRAEAERRSQEILEDIIQVYSGEVLAEIEKK
ncbi:MAG: FRG domain-containing protein [Clostridiaceae bacterium]|nr:FRG domain-containing protein [Clostridiaceae bacterium]